MKIHPQTIYKGKQPEFVVLPIREYTRLMDAFEDFQDIQEVTHHLTNAEETFPMEVVLALSEGGNPIKVYREYRRLSQTALAACVHVSKQYISQLENGDRAGTTRVLSTIAKVLHVDLGDLVT